jgi:hypothetical protein
MFMFGLVAVACLCVGASSPTILHAQGEGEACNEMCWDTTNDSGRVVGHACTEGEGGKNCVATVAKCTIDECTGLPGGGYALRGSGDLDDRAVTVSLALDPDGRILSISVPQCSEGIARVMTADVVTVRETVQAFRRTSSIDFALRAWRSF